MNNQIPAIWPNDNQAQTLRRAGRALAALLPYAEMTERHGVGTVRHWLRHDFPGALMCAGQPDSESVALLRDRLQIARGRASEKTIREAATVFGHLDIDHGSGEYVAAAYSTLSWFEHESADATICARLPRWRSLPGSLPSTGDLLELEDAFEAARDRVIAHIAAADAVGEAWRSNAVGRLALDLETLGLKKYLAARVEALRAESEARIGTLIETLSDPLRGKRVDYESIPSRLEWQVDRGGHSHGSVAQLARTARSATADGRAFPPAPKHSRPAGPGDGVAVYGPIRAVAAE
jgi:hypothetical protein